MRKLGSREEDKKKQKRNQMILGVVLVVVMFGSVFGIVVSSFGNSEGTEKIIYKGQEFTLQSNYYVFQVGEYSFYFLSDPRNFLEIESEFNVSRVLPSFSGQPLYVDSVETTASQDIYQNLNSYAERIQPSCYDEKNCIDENLPIKTCENNMIVIREAKENKVYEQENCVFIEGKKEDLLKLTDELLLRLIGFN